MTYFGSGHLVVNFANDQGAMRRQTFLRRSSGRIVGARPGRPCAITIHVIPRMRQPRSFRLRSRPDRRSSAIRILSGPIHGFSTVRVMTSGRTVFIVSPELN